MPRAADGSRHRIVFLARPDLTSQPGGDSVQILHTMRELERLGHTVRLVSPGDAAAPLPADCDILHCFNLLLSHQYEAAMAEARRRGIPCVLSPIYWDTTAFDRHAGTHAMWKRVAMRVVPATPWRRLLRSRFKSVAHNAVYAEALSRSLASADMLLPNSRAEDDALHEQFPHRVPARIVYNAVALPPSASPPSALPPPEGLPDRFILSVGRIERRKNQHSLIRAIGGIGVPLVLLGTINPVEAGYWRQCRNAARSAGVQLMHRPGVPWEQVFAYYRAAGVHAQPSWFETPGLSSLEAAVVGCPVVCTAIGSAPEYFGRYAEYCSPDSVPSIRDAVLRALAETDPAAREQRARFIAGAYTWEAAARATADAYDACLGAARRPEENPV